MLVEASELTKHYRVKQESGFFRNLFHPQYSAVIALENLNLSINEHEFVGILGRNGAGKSTLIKLLCGLQRPTSGTLRVLGESASTFDNKRFNHMAVIFGQKSSLWWDLPLQDSFIAARSIYKLEQKKFQQRLDFFITALDLGDVLRRPVRILSLGERVKSEIVFNLLHEPRLILLDEPTIGLDLVSKAQLRSFLRELVAKEPCSVILTSHDMGDIEQCSTRICVLEEGNIQFDGNKKEFENYLSPGQEIEIAPVASLFTNEEQNNVRAAVEVIPGVEHVEYNMLSGVIHIICALHTLPADILEIVQNVLGPNCLFNLQQHQVSFEQAVLHKMRFKEE